jgi:hypothetical protein
MDDNLIKLCQQKQNKEIEISWDELAEKYGYINGEKLRQKYKLLRKQNGTLPCREEKISDNVQEKLNEIDLQIIELKKEKVKFRDQRTEFNKIIRESARHENVMDEIVYVANIVAKEKPLIHIKPSVRKTNKIGVLQLSDWHYSLYVNNFLNTYNLEVFQQRINQIVKTTIEYGMANNIESLYVLLQGDFISSSIHDSLRVQNQEDVISQIIKTSEVLAEIINELSNYFIIHIASCMDNHSRVSSDKKKSIDKENYMRITEWYLKARLLNHTNVNFIENAYDMDIPKFKIYNYNCAMVHGHQDKFQSIVKTLTSYTRDVYDFIFTSHFHHPMYEQQNMVEVIGNGGLIGVDSYSASLRLSSYPSQNFIVIDKDTGLEAICPIKLK